MHELDLMQAMKRIEYLQRLNYELLDSYRNQIDWLFDFCKRHKINIPIHDLEKLIALSRIAGNVLDESSDDRIQPSKNHSSDEEEYRALFLVL
jgi:hypothetical protein